MASSENDSSGFLWYLGKLVTIPCEFFDKVTDSLLDIKYRLVTPSCHLKIRNLPRGFVDRSGRIMHAMFTILCDYVELEIGGENEYRRRLAMLYNSPEENSRYYYRMESKILALYVWYNRVDWSNPVPFPARVTELENTEQLRELTSEERAENVELLHRWVTAEDKFENICRKRMHSLVTVSPYLWT